MNYLANDNLNEKRPVRNRPIMRDMDEWALKALETQRSPAM